MSAAIPTSAGSGEPDVILRLEGVSKVYSGTVAVRHADFAVRRGSVNVLVGENGAGKSTLMKIIAGVEQPTAGRILIDGEPVVLGSRADAARRGIGIVFQELNLFANLSVAENIFAAREVTRDIRGIDHRAQQARARLVLDRLEADIDPRGPRRAISGSASSRSWRSPGAGAGRPHAHHGRTDVGAERRRGRGPVPGHRRAEGPRRRDRLHLASPGGTDPHRRSITVLRDGRIIGEASMRDVDVAWIVRQMIGSDAEDFAKVVDHSLGVEVFRAEEVSLARPHGGFAVERVTPVRPCRRDRRHLRPDGRRPQRVLRVRHGPPPPATGRIFIDGAELAERDVTGRIRRGVALDARGPAAEGLVAILSAAENLTLASLAPLPRRLPIRAEPSAPRLCG